MAKGIIMEIKKDYLIVMDKDGFIEKAQKENFLYSIGEEIQYRVYELENERFLTKNLLDIFRNKMAVASLMIVMIILVPLMNNFMFSNQTLAMVFIDVNPSVGLEINNDLEVIKLFSYNEDGDEIVRVVEWKNKDLELVIGSIIKETEKAGYIKNGREMLLSFSVENKDKGEKIEKFSKKIEKIENEVHQKYQMDVYVSKINQEDIEKAQKENVSPGKYHLKEKAKSKGVDLGDIKTKSIYEIKEKNPNLENFVDKSKVHPQENNENRNNENRNNKNEEKNNSGDGNEDNRNSNEEKSERKNNREKESDKKIKEEIEKEINGGRNEGERTPIGNKSSWRPLSDKKSKVNYEKNEENPNAKKENHISSKNKDKRK